MFALSSRLMRFKMAVSLSFLFMSRMLVLINRLAIVQDGTFYGFVNVQIDAFYFSTKFKEISQ